MRKGPIFRVPVNISPLHAGPSPPWLFGEAGYLRKVGQPTAFQEWRERYGPGLHRMQLASMGFLNVGKPETARLPFYHIFIKNAYTFCRIVVFVRPRKDTRFSVWIHGSHG